MGKMENRERGARKSLRRPRLEFSSYSPERHNFSSSHFPPGSMNDELELVRPGPSALPPPPSFLSWTSRLSRWCCAVL